MKIQKSEYIESKLNLFVESYVREILNLSSSKEDLSIDEFYSSLYDRACKNLSKTLNFSKEDIKHIHHSFHWAFFNDNDSKSPLEIYPNTEKTEDTYWKIRAKRKINLEDELNIIEHINKKYGSYLMARFEQVVNVPIQT